MNELPGTKFSTCKSGICKDLFLTFKVLKSLHGCLVDDR